MLTTDARTEWVAPAALPASQADFDPDCGLCGNCGCYFCLPQTPHEPDHSDCDFDPFFGEPMTDEEIEEQARHTHERVLAGELAWNAVYGDDGFCPFA